MEFQKLENNYKGLKFLIEEDYPNVGAYLYIYEGEKCIKDVLQDTIEMCKKVALEEYQVPIKTWRKINSN
jgi:hypothetical protein